MNFTIEPVNSKDGMMEFIKCQWNFYKNDPYWVPPMISDRVKLLDTNKNPFFKHSEMKMFLARSNGSIVGRIAGITNHNHNLTHNDKIGFFGFFECVNDQKVSDALFDEAGNWLVSKGMNVMRGPENPSMNDEIGLLVDGHDSSPMILMTYNPKYYANLIENYGFEKSKDVLAYLLEPGYLAEKVHRLQSVVRERYEINIREVNFKNKKQFWDDVNTLKQIYNSAWVPNWGFVKWTNEEFDYIANDLKMIADQRLAIIAETKGKVMGFALGLPDINECLIHNRKGGMLGALWHIMTKQKKIKGVRLIALGVMPEFQKTGVDSVLYYEIGERASNRGMIRGEASWVLEDNFMMNRALTTTMHGRAYKTYRLYDKNL